MKSLLALITALCLATQLARSAEPVVVIVSATSVTVDGAPAGKPADTIRNRPELASAIQRAYEAREAAQAAALADAQAKLAAALATNAELVGKLGAAGTNATALRAVRAEAVATERERSRAKLQAEIARRQRELEELDR